MVAEISLGAAYQSNGKTVLDGTEANLDTQSLINSLVAAKQVPATNLTTTNTKLAAQVTALNSLNSLLSQFQAAAEPLSNQPGVDNASSNIFEYRTATVSSSDGTDASNYLNVTVTPGASIQSFTVDQIKYLAEATKQQSGVFNLADTTTAAAVTASGSPSAGLFEAGTITLHNTDGTTPDSSITLNAGDSLQTVANDFNAVQSHTGIQANIIQVATGQYQIIFTGTNTGLANGFDLGAAAGSSSTVTGDPSGVLSQLSFHTQQAAQDADFTVDGIEVTRPTNSVSDLFSGITFNLTQPTTATGTTLSVSVQPDTTQVTTAVNTFADAYNKLKLFFSTQSQIGSSGLPTSAAVLANDSTMRTISQTVSNEVNAIVGGVADGQPSRLADIGITFSDFAGDDTDPATSNIMSVDTDTLTAALQSNFSGVAGVFQYQQTSDNSEFATYTESNNLSASSFQVSVDPTADTATGTYVDSSGNTQNVTFDVTAVGDGSIILTGQKGTAFDGSAYIYAGTTAATINVQVTQGIASQVYNGMADAIDPSTGQVTLDINGLTTQETTNTTQITAINAQVATYRDQLTTQYAQLESALAAANQVLDLLNAQSQVLQSQGS
jgi:flagellar hook-associated protein 2